MANKFKLHPVLLNDTSEKTLITAGSETVFIIGSILICNIHATTDSTVTLTITDSSASADFNILTTESIKRTVSREVLSRPLILENGDALKATAATGNIYNVFISYLDRDRT